MIPDATSERSDFRAGIGYALGAYVLWGGFPVYWKFLQHVPALEILAHRMLWSLVFLGVALCWRRRAWGWLWGALGVPRVLGLYLLASSLIALNWGLYIWAVNSGHVVETALGYFMNPLLNVLFGAVFLGERPRVWQWAAIGVAAGGVVFLTVVHGSLPWIALTLALSFALYGLVKKKATLGALEGLSLETLLLLGPALGVLVWVEQGPWQGGSFGLGDLGTTALLVGGGIATAVPLLCFAAAVRRLPLTLIGVIQYLAPTIQFLLGVFLYHEPFDATRLVGFVFIWSGLLLYTGEGLWRYKKTRERVG